ncbi:hypothetical protein DM01DRAFT_266312 [Hesseltinella vesiculosa]|uniref:Phospholipid/glycerol acyltransferase domain-containing protein n=1 Tax=Hesseltinella vesiculosa TaxID=101127 RepID=A0A1X2GHI6_9FUNG|nr:hypothetical protein DM01DRAFT_266312 [Hesseltinella vesiculosa]
MAQSSFKRHIIGPVAKLLNAIPVVRPQDLTFQIKGTLILGEEPDILVGQDTTFTQQVGPRDLLALSKTSKVEVLEVISDTKLRLKAPIDQEAQDLLTAPVTAKVTPHIDQSTLYTKVHERLDEGGCIVIFPEGGSHDQSQLLPLKAGFAIMALSAMAENDHLNVKIVPVGKLPPTGLNYFHPHRFRSRVVVSYGSAITVQRDLVDKYKQGGPAKREAIAQLLDEGHEGLKAVTTNAPDYDTLMILAAARRLYKPAATRKLRIDQVVDLNRRFLLGYRYFKDDPQCKELASKVKAYNNQLKYFGMHDHQVSRTESSLFSAAPILISRLVRLVILAILGFPALILNAPMMLVVRMISLKKQKEALAGSSVKVAARDVLASWKVIVALVVFPLLYGSYSVLLMLYLWRLRGLGLKATLGWGALSFAIQPFFAYAGVRLVETGLELLKSLKPLMMAVLDPDAASSLRTMREHLSEDVTQFVNAHGPEVFSSDFDPHRYDHLEERKKAAEAWQWRGLFQHNKAELIQHWFDDSALFHFHSHSSSEDTDDDLHH